MKDKLLIKVTLINLFIWTIYAQLDTTLPQYLAHTSNNPAKLFSILMVINATICVIFQPFILRWAELTSLRLSGMVGGAMFAISFLLLYLSSTTLILILAVIIMSFAELFTCPINGLLIMRVAPKHLIASYNGFYNLGLLGLSIGPTLGGIGLQYVGGPYVFLFDGLIGITIISLYLKSIPK